MNFVREFYNAMLSGRHFGKAIKCTRKGKFEDALSHYQLALLHEGKSGTGPNPNTLECVARAYARLGNMKEALTAAEESYQLYNKLNTKNDLIAKSIIRVEQFIAAIKSNNIDNINKMLKV